MSRPPSPSLRQADSPITHATQTKRPLNPALVDLCVEDRRQKRRERALLRELGVHVGHASMSEREVGICERARTSQCSKRVSKDDEGRRQTVSSELRETTVLERERASFSKLDRVTSVDGFRTKQRIRTSVKDPNTDFGGRYELGGVDTTWRREVRGTKVVSSRRATRARRIVAELTHRNSTRRVEDGKQNLPQLLSSIEKQFVTRLRKGTKSVRRVESSSFGESTHQIVGSEQTSHVPGKELRY